MSFLDGGGLNGYGDYTGAAAATDGTQYDSNYSYDADMREALKLDPYVPRPAGDARPWYERVAEYGLTRAIDSNFGPPPVNKTAAGATFAGQNGRTYSQVGSYNGVPPQQGAGWLPLILAGAVAVFALAG